MIAAPLAGMCSCPSTRGRNSSFNQGPRIAYFSIQYSTASSLGFARSLGRASPRDNEVIPGRPERQSPRTCDDAMTVDRRCGVGVLPGAEPYAADGGPVGVVLSHGFTG